MAAVLHGACKYNMRNNNNIEKLPDKKSSNVYPKVNSAVLPTSFSTYVQQS